MGSKMNLWALDLVEAEFVGEGISRILKQGAWMQNKSKVNREILTRSYDSY